MDKAAKGNPIGLYSLPQLTSTCIPRHTTLSNIVVQRSKGFHTAVTGVVGTLLLLPECALLTASEDALRR